MHNTLFNFSIVLFYKVLFSYFQKKLPCNSFSPNDARKINHKVFVYETNIPGCIQL